MRLERYESKGSRTVLRGGDGGNAVHLPDTSLPFVAEWCRTVAARQEKQDTSVPVRQPKRRIGTTLLRRSITASEGRSPTAHRETC